VADRPRVLIGDEDVGEAVFTMEMLGDYISKDDFEDTSPRYITGLRETTLTLEAAGQRLEDLIPVDGGARNISLSQTYVWSRWRRWLNAVLRVTWWPLGPRRLPRSWGLDVSEMYVTMAELQADGTMRVAMSSRKPDR
jgi:hypothetical protein